MANNIPGQPNKPFLTSFAGLTPKNGAFSIQHSIEQTQQKLVGQPQDPSQDTFSPRINKVTASETAEAKIPTTAPSFNPGVQHKASAVLFSQSKAATPTASFSLPTPSPSKPGNVLMADAVQFSQGESGDSNSQSDKRGNSQG